MCFVPCVAEVHGTPNLPALGARVWRSLLAEHLTLDAVCEREDQPSFEHPQQVRRVVSMTQHTRAPFWPFRLGDQIVMDE